MSQEQMPIPFHVFNFLVEFAETSLSDESKSTELVLCSGAFSECTGLEATMEHKVVKEGGRNYGTAQRVGQVTFATVVLKRGITSEQHLWKWFEFVSGGASAYRMNVTITLRDSAGQPVLRWRLDNALPVKFKAADFNAKGGDIGIEELHLVHEGLRQA